MTSIIAWHGDEQLKAKAIKRLREHRQRNQIVQGIPFDCARRCGDMLGCLTHDYFSYRASDVLFGIEKRIGFWLDEIFEHLPADECAAWAIESIEAIPVGADLSRCHHHFCAWILGESGLLTMSDCNCYEIQCVRLLHELAASGGNVTDKEWSIAKTAAGLAKSESWIESWASRTAESSADLSAASTAMAAEAAAKAAGWAAKITAGAAADACQSAYQAAWRTIAAKSIEIFRAAPIVASL